MWRRFHRRLLFGVVAAAAFTVLAAPAPGLAAPPGDILFILDESGSMGNEINDVEARLGEIVSGLNGKIDARYALVSFGGAPPGQTPGQPFARTNFTDANGFATALSGSGSFPGSGVEMGLFATTYAMNNVSGFRAGAPTCVVLLTDEGTAAQADLASDLAAAKGALKGRNAAWFGIVSMGFDNTPVYYGPSAGSLAADTGGAVYDIQDFRLNASAVLGTLLDRCAARVVERASLAAFTATPTSGVAPLTVVFDVTEDPAIVSSSWDFGDGETGEGLRVSHIFQTPGEYIVTRTVKDLSGQSETASQRISVRGSVGAVLPSDCSLLGTAGPDVLVGTPGNDVICGFGGNDIIRGGGGNDIILGGPGADTIFGGAGDDRLMGDQGNDVLKGGPGNDVLKGGAGRDQLWGGAGNDVLRGGAGADRLYAGPGANRLFGESGNDTLRGGAGVDTLAGGPGADRLLARDGKADRVFGGRGNDRARVDSALDRVRGIELILP